MGNMIDLDFTLFIQLINFIVAIVVLNYLLIKPVRSQLQERAAVIGDSTLAIESFATKASEKLSSYEAALSQARTAATQAREAVKTAAQAQEQQILAAAQADAQNFLQAAKTQVAADAKKVTATLREQVPAFAAAAVSKIIG